MKHRTLVNIVAGCLATIGVMADNVLIYNPINGYSLAYLISVDTTPFLGMTNVLFHPELPQGIPLEFTKVTNGIVVPLSFGESNAIVAARAVESDLRLRFNAASDVRDQTSPGLVLRALADTAKDEINILRNEISVAKTNITKFQSTPTLAPRTLEQLKTVMTNKINSGEVDSTGPQALFFRRK